MGTETGTGIVALAAARAGADVTAVDLAPNLIETATRLAADEGLQLRLEVGDAEKLPNEDGAFDVVSSNIGAIFAPDHAAVARELGRVSRPGGRLGMTAWPPESGPYELFRIMAPFQPVPPPPGVGNPFDWGRKEYAADLLSDCFELELVEGDGPYEAESGEWVWDLFSSSYGPTKVLADSLSDERRAELRRAVVDYYESYRVDGGVCVPRSYLLILGRRR